jgi:predicted RNA-binding Zn ribbon-like protein
VASRQPAPAPLSLVEDFVNTSEIDGVEREELLVTPADLARWLEERDLMEPGNELTEADRALTVRVREDLRALLLANNGEPLEDGAMQRLNEVAGGALLSVRFTGSADARLEPAAGGIAGALGRILAIVVGAMADGGWARLKACRNDECMWVFYDTSKNHSATWCSMRVCGNRMKARAYRKRRAEEHA